MSTKEKHKDPVADALHAIGAGDITAKPPEPREQAKAPETKEAPAVEAPKANTATVAPAPRRSIKMLPRQLTRIGNLWDAHAAIAPFGSTIDDVLQPHFWADVAPRLRPFDKVDIICEDGSWEASLRVVAVDQQWAKMKLRFPVVDLTVPDGDIPKTQEEEYDIAWTAMGKYAIRKKSLAGAPPLKDGFTTRLEAYQWLDGHIKSLNA